MSNTAYEMLLEMRQTLDLCADAPARETCNRLRLSIGNWRSYAPDSAAEEAMRVCEAVLTPWRWWRWDTGHAEAVEAVRWILARVGLGAEANLGN